MKLYSSSIAVIILAAACAGCGDEIACADVQQMLSAVNQARSVSRYCGDKLYATAPPLRLSFSLSDAAARHAKDMASRGFVAHQGSDGSRVGDRSAAVGYSRPVGENVAGGTDDLSDTMGEFLASSDHCANVMNPDAREFGAACVTGAAPYRVYWAQVFGT